MSEGREKAPFAPMNRNLITIPGMDGSYLSTTEKQPLLIRQPIYFKTENDQHSLDLKDELAVWLQTEEPAPLELDDEPGRIYYAVVQNTLEDFAYIANYRRGTIEFLVLDGYGYGQEKTLHFPSDLVAIENKGTAPADPIFELTATKKSTFAMIGNQDDEYIMLGQPADDDVQEVDTRTSVLYENGSTLSEWTHTENTDMVNDDSNIDSMDGEMGTDNAGIRADSYGTARNRQRGPAIFRELDEPIQDFEMETTFDILSNREIENFRMMIYFNDENMNPIGQFGIKDNTKNYKRRRPIAQVGEHNQNVIIGDSSWTNDNARNTTLFYFRMKREGKRFTFYVGEWQGQRHINVWEESFNDINNEFQGRLKYVTLFIGSYQDRVTPSRLRINSVELF